MRCFTNNPLERMMMQVPKGEEQRTGKPSAAPKGHHCYGCGQVRDAMRPAPAIGTGRSKIRPASLCKLS